MIDDVVYHPQKDYQSCIVKIVELYIHHSKLYSPSDFAVSGWRWFESHRVPICALKVLKMSRC